MQEDATIEKFYFRIIDIWKRFCDLHSDLYDHTCDEYSALLSNDVEQLDEILTRKNKLINRISVVEEARRAIIDRINTTIKHSEPIKRVSELLKLMNDYEKENELVLLNEMNDLLIDIIYKIQKQNKTNQLFLNRALMSLSEIKDNLYDNKKKYNTYDSQGLINSKIK